MIGTFENDLIFVLRRLISSTVPSTFGVKIQSPILNGLSISSKSEFRKSTTNGFDGNY